MGEFQVADFSGDDGALGRRLQAGDELGGKSTSLLGVQVAQLFRDIGEGSDLLVVTFFGSLFGDTTGAANFDGNFLARGVADKFSGSLFDVTGGAR